jgi:tetratricopeptide (TPR) repeat protein
LGEVELYGRLMQGFKSHPNPQTLLYTLADLADGLAQDGAPERAQEVANLAWQRAIEPDQDTSLRFALRYTLPSVLHARLAAGQPEGVEEILRQAETIPEDNHRAQAQANLAEILARAGQIDQALHLAEQAWTTAEKNLSSNFLGLYEVARAVAQVFGGQDPQRGLEVIQTTLPIARLTGSSEVMSQVEVVIELLATAGQRDTLWGIFEALREVGSW